MAELMTVEEVAGYLRVTKKTIYRLLKRGDITAVKVGRGWRFKKVSVDKWLDRQVGRKEATILVIDDREIMQLLLKETMERFGHRVVVARTGSEGLELVKQRDFDVVFLDLKMPGMDGAELFEQIKTVKPRLPVTIITGYPDSDMVERALAQGPFKATDKLFDESDIVPAVANFLRITQRG